MILRERNFAQWAFQSPHEWANYRPITIATAGYRISSTEVDENPDI
jgi:hypothetical protein